MEKVTLKFYPSTGKAVVTVNGVKGNKCTELTKLLEEGLGELTHKNFTEEHAENACEQETEHQ
jgi:hypothetical protein